LFRNCIRQTRNDTVKCDIISTGDKRCLEILSLCIIHNRHSITTMDIADMTIHRVACQKSDFHGNSDFQNSQKLDPLQITTKNSTPKYASLLRIFWC
jgi:hypothetical protein